MNAGQYLLRIARWLPMLLGFTLPAALAEDAPVTITGGADDNGQNYHWTVTNHSDSPIVRIEIPHYHGDQFSPPDGWKQNCTFLVNVGVPDKPGICVAYVDYPMQGLQPGQSKTIHLRIARAGAQHRPGTVDVHFANGSEFAVRGVELPTQATLMERYVGLVGFAVLFVLVLIFHARRQKRRAIEAANSAADDDPPPREAT